MVQYCCLFYSVINFGIEIAIFVYFNAYIFKCLYLPNCSYIYFYPEVNILCTNYHYFVCAHLFFFFLFCKYSFQTSNRFLCKSISVEAGQLDHQQKHLHQFLPFADFCRLFLVSLFFLWFLNDFINNNIENSLPAVFQ